ncbi:hypothetical protein AB0L42_22370 [Streptomyces sp. NPDC052287]|uniref:hypothetical protein n=1 Tax=Streptomyces sp. NPDC052287 TaxID=3154950 RepID=UPI00341BC658
MERLSPGDAVLFTGLNHVRGIGEIGALFRNAAFAASMRGADEDDGSRHDVYSLPSFTPVEIPYTEIWALPGFNAGVASFTRMGRRCSPLREAPQHAEKSNTE